MKQAKGFTLVELSIVLVIIGLLIGGILAAQSMILTAKIQRLIRDLQQYEISINNFKQNYNFYPGDSPAFTASGDGDGLLDGGGGCVGVYRNIEAWYSFAQLSQANMITGNYKTFSSLQCGGTMDEGTFSGDDNNTAPYTEMDSKAAPITGKKRTITTYMPSGSNFYLNLYINAAYTIPMETKLGSTTVSGSSIGFANTLGAGNCESTSFSGVSCNDSAAAFSVANYYLLPI